MRRPFMLVTYLFPVYAAWVLVRGALHPEEGQWRDFSKIEQGILLLSYAVASVLIAVNLVLLGPILLRRVRLRRIARMLTEAKSLQAAGRHAEAGRAITEIERLWKRYGLDKLRPLR